MVKTQKKQIQNKRTNQNNKVPKNPHQKELYSKRTYIL